MSPEFLGILTGTIVKLLLYYFVFRCVIYVIRKCWNRLKWLLRWAGFGGNSNVA